jgi:hypothetical protein
MAHYLQKSSLSKTGKSNESVRRKLRKRGAAQETPEVLHSVPQSHQDILYLQRTIGNKAVNALLNGQRTPQNHAQTVIQREPMVYNFNTKQHVDAADWELSDIKIWEQWYNGQSNNLKRFYKDDFDALQELRKTDRIKEEIRFEANKSDITRDPRKVGQATMLVAQFDAERYDPQWAFNFDKDRVVQELLEVVNDPAKMDQKGYPICGADTYLRIYAIHHPDAYVQYAIDLLKTGIGRLGTQVVQAPREIKAKDMFARDMRMSDWVATASLRSQSNKIMKNITQSGNNFFKEMSSGAAGSTMLGDVKKWFLRAGIPPEGVVEKSHYLTNTSARNLADINQRFRDGWAIELMINADIVDNALGHKIKPALTFHLVTVASEIMVTSDGRNYIGEVMTWGSRKRIRFKASQLGRAILGYVAADISKLGQNNQNQQEEEGNRQTRRR